MSLSRLRQDAIRRRLLQSSLWFVPQQHVWIQCSPPSLNPNLWRVQWGLTEEGMDRLGDVTSLTSHVSVNDSIAQGQTFLSVQWQGYAWTEADELYHTVWETVDGEESILSPVSGKVVGIADSATSVIDENIVWAELECPEQVVLRDAPRWIDEPSYQKWVETLAPSKFSDHAA